jgi:hypothetical protein
MVHVAHGERQAGLLLRVSTSPLVALNNVLTYRLPVPVQLSMETCAGKAAAPPPPRRQHYGSFMLAEDDEDEDEDGTGLLGHGVSPWGRWRKRAGTCLGDTLVAVAAISVAVFITGRKAQEGRQCIRERA